MQQNQKVMFENLNQPYPFNNNFKHNLRTISLVSMGFMLIVLYFQPFGINFLATASDGYFVLIIGIVSAATFLFSTLVLPGLFQRLFEPSKWTIRKELIWNFGMFVVLVAGFSISALIFRVSGFQSLTVFRAGALALLPLILFNLVNYNRSLKTRVSKVIDSGRHWLADDRKSPKTKVHMIRIESENSREVFEKDATSIILIKSASNYIEIFYREGNLVQKVLIRQTLSHVESKFSGLTDFMKCHRCCLVNISQVRRLTGTSPNYYLESDGLDFHIPVSRQNVSTFRKILSGK